MHVAVHSTTSPTVDCLSPVYVGNITLSRQVLPPSVYFYVVVNRGRDVAWVTFQGVTQSGVETLEGTPDNVDALSGLFVLSYRETRR